MDKNSFQEALADLNLGAVSTELFEEFENKLYEWNSRKNLTRIPQEEAWLKHFIDSLLMHDLIPNESRVLDLGTGPGLPAWPLAAARPDLQVVALDSNAKMLEFLRTFPLPNLDIVLARIEDRPDIGEFHVVTGRALAPLSIQLEVSARAARLGGFVIPMRTMSDRPEAERLSKNPFGLELTELVERELPGSGAMRLFPKFEKTRETRNEFPRSWAAMKKKPV